MSRRYAIANRPRDSLLDRKALLGVHNDSLKVSDEHVEDQASITDGFDVRLELERLRGADRLHFGPDKASGGVRSPLRVRLGDQQNGVRREASLG